MNSREIIHLYDEIYFLGGISKFNGQKIGCGGWEEFREGKVHQSKIMIANSLIFKDKNVLDIGYSRGEMLKYCHDNGAKSCVGVDYSSAAFSIASNYLKDTNVKLYCLAVDEIAKVKENDFEVVYINDVLEHISNSEWEMCFKALKPKLNVRYKLLARTPATRRGDYLQMHNNYQTHASLMALFDGVFKVVEIKKIAKTLWIHCEGINCI